MSGLHDLSDAEKRARAVEDLINGEPPGVIAERYGVNRATISRWHTPEVHAERDKRRAELIAASRARLAGMVGRAIDALDEIANDPAAPPPARVAAANSILDRAGAIKVDEITVRVEEADASSVAAGLLAILGRAQAELGSLPEVVEAADPSDPDPDPA